MYTDTQHTRETLLLCRECGALLPVACGPWPADADDEADSVAFRARHSDHTIERAVRTTDPAIFDRPPWDPMATSWFRITVGEMTFHAHSLRGSIDEPRRYNLCSAPPPLEVRTEVDEVLLRRALRHHFADGTLNGRAEEFVDLVTRRYAMLDPRELEISFDDPDFPNAEIGPCPDDVRADLRREARELFGDDNLHIETFIRDNLSEYGALAVRVRTTVVPDR